MKVLPFSPFKLRNILVIAALSGAGWWFWHSEINARTGMHWGGLPVQKHFTLSNYARVFRNEAYLVGYSELRRNPLWVTYRLKPVANPQPLPRPEEFLVDKRSLMRVTAGDYSQSGYDRGHLAPNYAISVQHGAAAQLETFRMTNITPQKPKLNQKLWQRIEEQAFDRLAAKFGEIWVVTGPVFDENEHRQFLESGVEIPVGFYKIFIAPDGQGAGKPSALTFFIPQDVNGDEDLSQFATTIDAIEFFTGLDFFPELPDIAEEKLEESVAGPEWEMDGWANLPGRY